MGDIKASDIKPGRRFVHRHFVDANLKPEVFVVTAVRKGLCYFTAAEYYDQGSRKGMIFRPVSEMNKSVKSWET